MFFTTVTELTNILFKGWNTHTWKDVCTSAIIICALTIIFEGLKAGKSYVKLRQQKRHEVAKEEDQNNEFGLEITSMRAELIAASSSGAEEIKIKRFFFLCESLIHMFNAVFGYILMLLVMTYSVWFIVAVVVGSAAGYFISHPVLEHLTAEFFPPEDRQGDHSSGKGDGHQEGFGSISTTGTNQGAVL
ncbi:unnamed protein product [Candidula unifasciata]|uniref:Copper transport protein n=1 Tax=Candidula unifasciata TaxID=100452 RepID=A0A8S3ZC57_9EUPU|nr:unnamed protein product [Candidula unifasciata]